MDDIFGLGGNLAWAAIGYSAKSIYDWYKLSGDRKIWSGLLDKNTPIHVVLTTKKNSNSARATPKISLGELQAFSELELKFRELNKKLMLEASTEISTAKLNHCHIISFGGPLANSITKDLLNRIQSLRHFPIAFDEATKSFTYGNNKYSVEYNSNGQEIFDYGFVAKYKIGEISGKPQYALIAFGCHSWGTLGAARTILDKKLVKKFIQKEGKDGFVALMKFRIETTNPVFLETIDCLALEKP
jgi:hypothetical protein